MKKFVSICNYRLFFFSVGYERLRISACITIIMIRMIFCVVVEQKTKTRSMNDCVATDGKLNS